MNGKVFEFIKDHWIGLLGTAVVCVAILYGVYACSQHTTVDVVTKGNRVWIDIGVKPKTN